jgi:L-histidine N-alpha-methyltransferase
MTSIASRTERAPSTDLVRDVQEGLSRPQKELPPKYFYDRRGSELFDAITRLPEYYLTRTERALLGTYASRIVGEPSAAALVELGAGSAEKTRILLDAMGDDAYYVPVDVSAEFLEETASRLRTEYGTLTVEPVIGDIGEPLALPDELPSPALFAFLGSTIGNFDLPEAARVLRGVRDAMRAEDRFVLGADLRKNVATIEAAYNDAAGVTAAFNRNVLRVINRELGADFDVRAFVHHAIYRRALHRIEMHLVSTRAQRVTIPGVGRYQFERGETIRTEISCKYDRATVLAMLDEAGLQLTEWLTDTDASYALVVAERGELPG